MKCGVGDLQVGERFFAGLNDGFEVFSGNDFERGFNNPDLILDLRRAIEGIRERIQGALRQAAEGNCVEFNGVVELFPKAVEVIEGIGRHGECVKISAESIMEAYLSEKAKGFMEALAKDQSASLLDQVGGGNETVIETGEIIVPPSLTTDGELMNNGGVNVLDLSLRPKYALCQEVLQEMGITPSDYVVYKGDVSEEMVRTEPYFLFAVPVLNRLILICDQYNNRTFVVRGKGEADVSHYQKVNKEALKSDPQTKGLIWIEDPQKWKAKLKELLKNDISWQVNPKAPRLIPVERDREYYSNSHNVLADLEALAKAVSERTGEEKGVEDLSIHNISSERITCSNGEEVRGGTYLRNAAVALGLAENTKTASTKAETLKVLRWIAGESISDHPSQLTFFYPSMPNWQLGAKSRL